MADAFIAATAYFEDSTTISDIAELKRITEIKNLAEKKILRRQRLSLARAPKNSTLQKILQEPNFSTHNKR